jgi:hypothetical protein
MSELGLFSEGMSATPTICPPGSWKTPVHVLRPCAPGDVTMHEPSRWPTCLPDFVSSAAVNPNRSPIDGGLFLPPLVGLSTKLNAVSFSTNCIVTDFVPAAVATAADAAIVSMTAAQSRTSFFTETSVDRFLRVRRRSWGRHHKGRRSPPRRTL